MTAPWVEQYLGLAYEDGARGPDRFDCWGLVREARHAHCGCRLLPSWGHVRHDMGREFTRAYAAESALMEEAPAEHGSIAVCFRGRIAHHVALVVSSEGQLWALEVNPGTNVRVRPLRIFERDHLHVRFYRDRECLPEQAGRLADRAAPDE